MRLDHGPMAAQPTSSAQESSNNPAPTASSPTWEPEPEPDDGPIFARNVNADRERGYRYGYGGRFRGRGDASEEGDEFGYTLFCGGENADTDMDIDVYEDRWSSTSPYEPSALPLYPPVQHPSTSASSSSASSSRRPRPRSTGCGALLHMHASPRRRLGVWTAKIEASTGAVVSLDAEYFDRAAVAKIVRSACGCVREGVGCAVWLVLIYWILSSLTLSLPAEILSEHATSPAKLPPKVYLHHSHTAAPTSRVHSILKAHDTGTLSPALPAHTHPSHPLTPNHTVHTIN